MIKFLIFMGGAVVGSFVTFAYIILAMASKDGKDDEG